MNIFFRRFSLLLILPLFFACSSDSEDEDVTKKLKLSVIESEEGNVTTENVDFEFEILDGNGGYTASVSETDGDPDAKITIDGNKVIVNLLVGNHNGAEVIITDKKNQKALVYIKSILS